MSKILESLYALKTKLDAGLAVIREEQSKMKAEITEKRTTGWERMFEDLFALSKYSDSFDTGIVLYSGRETLGFELRDNGIVVISWEHVNRDKEKIEPRKETYFFKVTKDKPFYTDSHYSRWMEFVLYAVENWDDVMSEIEKRLAKHMELEMRKSVNKSKEEQLKLEKQLKAIGGSVK